MKYLLLLLSILPGWAFALKLELGSPLPAITIANAGELQLVEQEFRYSPWNTQQLRGKVRLVQAMAGRSSAKELNAAMIEAIKAANFSTQSYQTTTIINLDDAVFGTSGFVRSKLKKNKKSFPQASFVVDDKGKLFDLLELRPKSSAIILVDPEGRVLFAKDGQLSQQEVQQVITLIQSQI